MDEHLAFLRLALQEASKCVPSPTAFCVGCVIAVRWPLDATESVVLATGYSREFEGNTHAEANALRKARDLFRDKLAVLPNQDLDANTVLSHADVYTTMEPCSIRASGLPPCADMLIAAKIRRCFIGVGEPDDFVRCQGADLLSSAGVEVVWVKGIEEECLNAARRS